LAYRCPSTGKLPGVKTRATTAAEFARELEAQLDEYPEERGQILTEARAWPQLVEHTDTDSIVRDREMDNRDLFHAGIARITMVPLTARELAEFAARTGGDPVDEATRHACMDVIIDEGGASSWPPPRNAPCWCGSGSKYKKCCGGPNLA
jgi:SEC-C motif